MRIRVERQISEAQRRLAHVEGAAAAARANREEFLALERLDEVVVGSGVKSLDPSLGGSRALSTRIGTSSLSRNVRAASIPSRRRQAEIKDTTSGRKA